jgi:hypothetical protein
VRTDEEPQSKDAAGTARETALLTITIRPNDKPRPAVHKEKLGHALSLNMIHCEAIHDGEILQNHGVLTMLTGPTWLVFLAGHFFV